MLLKHEPIEDADAWNIEEFGVLFALAVWVLFAALAFEDGADALEFAEGVEVDDLEIALVIDHVAFDDEVLPLFLGDERAVAGDLGLELEEVDLAFLDGGYRAVEFGQIDRLAGKGDVDAPCAALRHEGGQAC